MLFTLTFCYVSPSTQDYESLVDQNGNDVTLQVEANSRTEAIYKPESASFCKVQGNDCRVRGVTNVPDERYLAGNP